MKVIKKGIIFVLILFCFSIPTFSYAESKSSPVILTTGLPFFPKDCNDIEDDSRKKNLCYEKYPAGTMEDDVYSKGYSSEGLIVEVFKGIFKFILGSAGTLCVIMLIVSGLKMAFAAGNAATLGAARSTMKDSIIGLILTISSGFILSIINPQLLEFDIKGPEEYTISFSKTFEGKKGSRCVDNSSCNGLDLYCYKKNNEDLTGTCKEYIEPFASCNNSLGELCREGYICELTSGNRSFSCLPSTSINNLQLNEKCIVGNLNCNEGLYCNVTDKTKCDSCNFYYNQRKNLNGSCPSSSYNGYTASCNNPEIKEGNQCPLKETGDSCSLDGECNTLYCSPTTNKCENPTCTRDSDCISDQFCNNVGICEDDRDLDASCGSNNDCESGQCEGDKCVCGIDTDCPTTQKCKATLGDVNFCYTPCDDNSDCPDGQECQIRVFSLNYCIYTP